MEIRLGPDYPTKRIYRCKFPAVHYIKDHPKCGRPHPHMYELKVTAQVLLEWFDFHDLKASVIEALKMCNVIDHDNSILGAKTCEELAMEIRKNLIRVFGINDIPFGTIQIELFETEHFGVIVP